MPRKGSQQQFFFAYLLPIAAIHGAALLAVWPWLFTWTALIVMLVGTHAFGTLGINLGYHRLLSHRSFSVPRWLERVFTLLALCCMQDTPARWVANHRVHHAHSDDEEDPHSPVEGFVWSHVGWLFRRTSAHNLSVYQKYSRDILEDRWYMWLEKHPAFVGVVYLAHAALFFLVGLLLGGVQFGASLLVWGVFVRTVAVWHITWSVNSLTHLFGYRNYETGDGSRNNWFVSLIGAGEGWHNNHHRDPASASVQHRWWEFDLSYRLIWLLERVGLAWDVVPPWYTRTRNQSSS
ncbi:MAG: fatty acid desaturase [Pirellulales bacterium]